MESTTTIEVNGTKFEVDLRTAKKIESFKVGDPVKVLVKDYSGYKAHAGCIVGIDAFKNLPTIIIAYIPSVFANDGKLEFVYMNAQTEGVEICPMERSDILPNRETVTAMFNRSIEAKQREIRDIEARRDYFLRQFGTTFGVGAADVAAATQPTA